MSIDNQLINEDARPRFIEMLQKQLIRENPSALPDYGVDGEYGSETQEWVTRFQERKGLQVDGVAGPETLGRLREDIIQRPGDRGNGIEILQQDLQYFYIEQTAVDGIYGSGTEQGVRDFQYYNSLTIDGIAGPVTLKMFDELMTTLLVQRYDENALVRRIQKQLNEQEGTNVDLKTAGVYGPLTEDAIKEFQAVNDQQVDGIAGPVTMNLLDLQATHPASQEEYISYFEEQGLNPVIQEAGESTKSKYGQLLESNNVFKSNISFENPALDNPDVVNISFTSQSNSMNFVLVSGQLEDEPTLTSYALFDADEEKAMAIAIINVQGDQYQGTTTLDVYDTEGNSIESVEESTLELTNSQLNLEKQIVNELFEATASNRMSSFDDGVDVDNVLCAIESGAIALSACAITGFYVGACTLILSGVLGDIWCPYEENDLKSSPLP